MQTHRLLFFYFAKNTIPIVETIYTQNEKEEVNMKMVKLVGAAFVELLYIGGLTVLLGRELIDLSVVKTLIGSGT